MARGGGNEIERRRPLAQPWRETPFLVTRRSVRPLRAWVVASALAASSSVGMPLASADVAGEAGIRIREATVCGKRLIEIENSLHLTTLAPEIGRFPLYYVLKATGHDLFTHPEGLDAPERDFAYYGGIVDAIPWTSGQAGGKQLPEKGLAHRSPWTWRTEASGDEARFVGSTVFEYADPVTGDSTRLAYEKTVTGYAGSARVRLAQRIENTGVCVARFEFSAHARMGVGGSCDSGDYFFAPGGRAFIFAHENVPELARALGGPTGWAEWPVQAATDFVPGRRRRNVFAFVPAAWCVVGDEKSGETAFFISSPVRCGAKTSAPWMGLLMSNFGCIVEPSVSPCVSADPGKWAASGNTVTLQPGEVCAFTLDLVAYQGLARADVEGAHAVYPDCVVVDKPELTLVQGNALLKGRVALAGRSLARLMRGATPLAEKTFGPGIQNLSDLGVVSASQGDTLRLRLDTASGAIDMEWRQ